MSVSWTLVPEVFLFFSDERAASRSRKAERKKNEVFLSRCFATPARRLVALSSEKKEKPLGPGYLYFSFHKDLLIEVPEI